MPIDPITLGAGISGVSQLATNLLGNAGNRKAQDRANQHNVNFWNMQNKYNHPVEQMARLKQAGLNPNLIYGSSPSGASGNADKIAPSKAPEYNMDNPLQHLGAFQNFKTQKLQNDNLEEQNNVLVQDALLKNNQALKTASEGASAKIKAEIDKKLLQTSVDSQKELFRQMQQRTIGFQIDNLIKNRTMADKVKQETTRLQLLQHQVSGQQLTNELRKLETMLKHSGLENSGPIMRMIFKNFIEPENIDWSQFIPIPIRNKD